MKEKIKQYIDFWVKNCYKDGLPDDAPLEISNMVPSYKRIAIAILKNDYPLETLGYSPPKSKIYDSLKKIELKERAENPKPSKIKIFLDNIQLTIFDIR